MGDEFYNLVAYTDGGSRGNPGPSACAVWLPQFDEVTGLYIPYATNNEAEYHGLILALNTTLVLGYKHLKVYTDSQLMQRQITGQYSVKSEKIIPLFEGASDIIAGLSSFEIYHVPRSANKRADAECNRVMDEFRG